MGYDIHITRRDDWWDEERLGTALNWASGEISAKNPSCILIVKMRRVAKALNARGLGDDGEYYDE